MTIEPRPLTTERRQSIATLSSVVPDSNLAAVYAALLYAEAERDALRDELEAVADADDTGIATVADLKHWAKLALAKLGRRPTA